MARLSFEFRVSRVESRSFDPDEFWDCSDKFEVREELLNNLPMGVDDDSVNYAASVIWEAIRAAR